MLGGACFDIFDGRWSSGSWSLAFIHSFVCKVEPWGGMVMLLLGVEALLLEVYWIVHALGRLEGIPNLQ